MDKVAKKILRRLAGYWNGKRARYPGSSQPLPGGWVAEAKLAEDMRYEVDEGTISSPEWRKSIELLKKLELIERGGDLEAAGRLGRQRKECKRLKSGRLSF